MKTVLLLLFFAVSSAAIATPHLDLETSSDEYRALLRENTLSFADDARITEALRIGDRLSKWIEKINAARAPSEAIRLTSPQNRISYPIKSPKTYNPKIIGDKTQEILRNLPQEMRETLMSTGELPTQISTDDETFIKLGRLLDRNYQDAARYKTLLPWKSTYVSRASNDVRGFWYLNSNNIQSTDLKDVSAIPANRLSEIKLALVRLCLNAGQSIQTCQKMVEKAQKENRLSGIYDEYFDTAKKNWDTFFRIPNSAARRDVKWTSNTMTVPFNTPSIEKFIPYLRDNIQDEWRWGSWALKLNFGQFFNGPRLDFKAGTLPHADSLGGNQIVMDSNQPIEEYESQWTIRHEFGHIIGFPDCYHEFYDTETDAFISYQLDTTDLMCSRAGNMKERLFLELQRIYQK